MLGIRLNPDEEERLARHARDLGRPKSAIVREWIVERLDRDSVDAMVARAALAIAAAGQHGGTHQAALDASDSFSQWLDAEDGGYDWGPEGPPPFR